MEKRNAGGANSNEVANDITMNEFIVDAGPGQARSAPRSALSALMKNADLRFERSKD
ncbi:MAG: hypothetical protein KAX31_01490 [Thermoplasmata archaeon]|nr:hypothetical protein [Thermoplasmata archaeon]